MKAILYFVVALGAVWLASRLPLVGAIIAAWGWPRYVVIPVAVAVLLTRAEPDGRRADRWVMSWIASRLSPPCRSAGRPAPPEGQETVLDGTVAVAPDTNGARLRRGRVSGPAEVVFQDPVAIRSRRRRHVARPVSVGHTPGRRDSVTRTVELAAGEVLEIRP